MAFVLPITIRYPLCSRYDDEEKAGRDAGSCQLSSIATAFDTAWTSPQSSIRNFSSSDALQDIFGSGSRLAP